MFDWKRDKAIQLAETIQNIIYIKENLIKNYCNFYDGGYSFEECNNHTIRDYEEECVKLKNLIRVKLVQFK